MKPEELRIGNWVQRLDGTYFQVKSGDIYSIDGWSAPKYLLPNVIPLTEEWLIKADFEGSIQEGFMKDGFFIAHITTEDNFEFEFRLPASDGWIIIPVKYVHKLQNLWFELKGEELTIKAESAK